MKKNLTFAAVALAIFVASCTSNSNEQGIKIGLAKGAKISSSGLKTTNNGLTYRDSYLTVNGSKTDNNEVQLGQKIAIVFDGIEGFKETNGKVFPTLSILVLDDKKQVVLNYDDLLKSDTGYNTKDAEVLTGALTIGDPLKQGQSYNLTVTVGDKGSESAIVGNINLKVK